MMARLSNALAKRNSILLNMLRLGIILEAGTDFVIFMI